MKIIYVVSIILLTGMSFNLQAQESEKKYEHQVKAEEVLQTKIYTYLRVTENINDKDSSYWLALPSFEPAVGDVYYYSGGLKMGEFNSKELNKTFSQIIFLGDLSKSLLISDHNTIFGTTQTEALPEDTVPAIVHTVSVLEVLQTNAYTYLRVKENDAEHWIACTKISAKPGEVYTYNDAAEMTNFTSRELNRTFAEILFVASLKSAGNSPASPENSASQDQGKLKSKKNSEKKTSVKAPLVSIETLSNDKGSYAGKIVSVRGEVTRYSSDILNTNWIHLNDASGPGGKADLTIMSTQTVKVGDKITATGMIHVERDFGSGYYFDVIMEQAEILIQ